jgi:hypothetical protein
MVSLAGGGGSPVAAADLDSTACSGVLREMAVEGGAAHPGDPHQFGDVGAIVGAVHRANHRVSAASSHSLSLGTACSSVTMSLGVLAEMTA